MPDSSNSPPLNWWTKRKLYRLGHYLLHEMDGVTARPVERHRVRTHTSLSCQEWAIDFRSCGASSALDAHYLRPSNDYRTVPLDLKPADRRFWRKQAKRLVAGVILQL